MTSYLWLLPVLGFAAGAGFFSMCSGTARRDRLGAQMIGGASGAATGALLWLAAVVVLA